MMNAARLPSLALLLALGACHGAGDGAVDAEAPITAPPAAIPKTPADGAAASTSGLDGTDRAAFDHVRRAVLTARTASEQIWKEAGGSYRFDAIPMYFVRRDAAVSVNERGFLFQHPAPQGQAMSEAAFAELGPVFRYDAQKDVIGLENFDFAVKVAGKDTFVFPYKPSAGADDEDPSVPNSEQFFYLLVHEAFHRFQLVEDAWAELPGWTQDEAHYPLTRDNVALGILEHEILTAGLETSDVAAKDEALQQLVAVRKARIALPSVVVGGVNFVTMLDMAQENIEGTALYVELRYGEVAQLPGAVSLKDDLVGRLSRILDRSSFQTVADVREEFVFGREYATGAATGALLDQVDAGDWRSPCKTGAAPYDFAAKRYPAITGATADAKLAAARAAHDYASILATVDHLLSLPPGPPLGQDGPGSAPTGSGAGSGHGRAHVDHVAPYRPNRTRIPQVSQRADATRLSQ